MIDINQEIMAQIAAAAKQQSGGDARWCRAIDSAVKLLANTPYVHFEGDTLLVVSDTSANVYNANGSCQCEAFKHGKPCRHRAAARLLRRYHEALQNGALWIPKPHGETETAIKLDALPTEPRRSYFQNSGEWETLATHSAWCVGCFQCWTDEEAA